MRELIDEGYKKAKKILTKNLDDLHKLAEALLEYELLSGDEIEAILKGEKLSVRVHPVKRLNLKPPYPAVWVHQRRLDPKLRRAVYSNVF